MRRQLSEASLAAKEIRAKLKKAGIKAKVQTRDGNTVNIYLTNANPAVKKAVEEQTDCYEYGAFDSMTDCQLIKNTDFEGPQAKWVFVHNEITADVKQAFYDMLRRTDSWFADFPESYERTQNQRLPCGSYVASYVWRKMHDMQDAETRAFWRALKPVKKL